MFGVEHQDVLGLDVLESIDDGPLQFANVHSVLGVPWLV